MTPERWREVAALFAAVVDEPDRTRRNTLLGDAAARDPDLAAEVRSLLDHHHRSAEFLEQPAWMAVPEILEDPPPLTGARVGPYLVGAELGRGGMGIVYAAEDERLRRRVALKALPPAYARDPDRRARLTREARAAAGLSHPCVATVYALEDIDGELYISSELVAGHTLRAELAAGPLGPAVLMDTLVATASALAAAHALGIVHRDLKPENVMRRTDGQIKVLDFGLAREAADGRLAPRLTADGLPMGTPGYAAPEQWHGAATDPRADVFAFGVLAWELATGEHPFGTDPAHMAAHMAAFLAGTPPTVRRPPQRIEAIALRCLRGDPADRYPSAAEILDDLRSGTPPARGPAGALWWWQFHQGAAALVDAATATILIASGGAFAARGGRWVWIGGLVLATTAVTMRLNLVFLSRVHPEVAPARRVQLFRWIAAAEGLLALLVIASVTVLAGDGHDAVTALLLTLAVATLASLVVIEPATTAAAGLGRRSA